MTTHTPTPWTVTWSDHDNNGPVYFIEEAYPASPAEHDANAAFIVRACNSHDDLVNGLDVAIWHLQRLGFEEAEPEMKKLRSILAKARGE